MTKAIWDLQEELPTLPDEALSAMLDDIKEDPERFYEHVGAEPGEKFIIALKDEIHKREAADKQHEGTNVVRMNRKARRA